MARNCTFFNQDWHCWTPNAGFVETTEAGLILGCQPANVYSDGQIDDYGHDQTLKWQPPVTLELTARFNLPFADFAGTAGFGWWNDPGGTGTKRLRLPRAVWFFAVSQHSQLELAPHAPLNGWNAMSIDASTWRFWSLLPFAPLGLLLMQSRWWKRKLMPVIQWMLCATIRPINVNWCEWQHYRIEWLAKRVRCWVNDDLVLDSAWSPRAPLGLVLWIDNQYAIVKPNGILRGGVMSNQQQTLEICNFLVNRK